MKKEESKDQNPEPPDFVTDPAVRRELVRRIEEITGLIDEADDILGEILDGLRRDE